MYLEKPVKLIYDTQRDLNYDDFLKFHHVFHGYPTYHDHDFYEFIIFFQGTYTHIIDGVEHQEKKLNCTFLFPQNAHMIIETSENSSHYCVCLKKERFEKIALTMIPSFFELFDPKKYNSFVLSEARLKKIVFMLSQIKEKDEANDKIASLISFLVFNLLEPMFNQKESLSENNRPGWLNDLLAEINNPNNLHWNVSDVVKRTNYSKTHLSRLFKEYMNEPIGEYIQKVKLSSARDILVNSDISITELCDLIGHSSMSHFSNTFKKTYGLAPGKYREIHKLKE